MSFEDMFRQERREGREEGFKAGRIDAVLNILEEFGTVPTDLKEHILTEHDEAKISQLLKAAVRSKSLEEFTEKISNL